MRLIKRFLVFLFVLAIAAVIAFFVIDPQQQVQDRLDEALAKLSTRLGRTVTADPVELSYRPLRASLTNVRVEGHAGGKSPLEVGRIEVALDGPKALRSFGKDLRLKSITVHEPRLYIERVGHGSSVDDIIRALRKRQPRKPLTAAERKRLERQRFDIEVVGGRLDLRHGEHVATVRDGQVTVAAFTPGQAFHVIASGAAFAERKNLTFDVEFGVPEPGERGVPVERFHLEAEALPLTDIAAFVKDADLSHARLEGRLQVEDPQQRSGPTRISGGMLATRVALGGEQFALQIAPHVSFSLEEGWIRFAKTLLAVDEMSIEIDGGLTQLTGAQPRFEAFTLRSQQLDLGRLAARFPNVAKAFGQTDKVSGPMDFELTGASEGAGQTIDAQLGLTQTAFQVDAERTKPAGRTLDADLSVTVEGTSVLVRDVELRVGQARLSLLGRARSFRWAAPGKAQLDLTANLEDTGEALRLGIAGALFDPVVTGAAPEAVLERLLDAMAPRPAH